MREKDAPPSHPGSPWSMPPDGYLLITNNNEVYKNIYYIIIPRLCMRYDIYPTK